MFSNFIHNKNDKSKTLNKANQSEVSIEQNISETCFSAIEKKAR